MKNVIINIKSSQGLNGEREVMELKSEGTLERIDGGFVLSYFEDTVIEGARIKTALTALESGKITLAREGAISSRLLIEEGVRNNCFYSVPEGNLSLGIFGKEVIVRLSDSGGSIKMVYTIDADMKSISENTVEIKIRER
ncbi:MAG: DUF1934 domain-containing protein [Clostridia bacterium]|nr:DUF1934 domain-containing protein [Clostridia bacterium]